MCGGGGVGWGINICSPFAFGGAGLEPAGTAVSGRRVLEASSPFSRWHVQSVFSSSLSPPITPSPPLPSPLLPSPPLPDAQDPYVSMAAPPRASPIADCLLVGMQARTPIVRSCLSALSFLPPPSLPYSSVCSRFLSKRQEQQRQGLLGMISDARER